MREEIGYDGWRLDFVRGFWGGYVKDYLEASEPYFAVGEYWDSLGYTYGEMDHNQDAHGQRITLERCEYWHLSDQKGKPPENHDTGSTQLKICKAERDVYAAIVNDKVAMKIGPGHFEPPSGSQRWSSALEGRHYKIWEAS
ncbi:Alpha-amylase 3, chloroplastic [Glycine soja]